MRKYEIMVIIDPNVDERQVPTMVDKHLQTITNGGGTVDNVDVWGRRQFTHQIMKKSEGIYVVIDITAKPDDVAELDRLMAIDESVMRTKLMRKDA